MPECAHVAWSCQSITRIEDPEGGVYVSARLNCTSCSANGDAIMRVNGMLAGRQSRTNSIVWNGTSLTITTIPGF